MKKIRYAHKNTLCEYDLSLDFFKELGIKINDVVPLRKVFLLYTDEGNKILKKVNYDIDRINIISDSLDYIKKKYSNVIAFDKLKNNLNYIQWKDNLYVVMDLLKGREATFSNPIEIELCAENLAMLHNASNGLKEYLEKKYSKDMMDISLKDKFTMSYDNLCNLKEMVSKYKYKNEFDELFMQNVDKYLNEIVDVNNKLEKSSYTILRNMEEKISICHNDLAYHNFLINDRDVNILDFDFMTIDLRVMDVADFILKSIKNVAFDINKIILEINSYEKVNKLSLEEKEVLGILIEFPRDFYSIVDDYYNKRKSWDYDVFLNRLLGKLDNESFRYEFLETYNKMLNGCLTT